MKSRAFLVWSAILCIAIVAGCSGAGENNAQTTSNISQSSEPSPVMAQYSTSTSLLQATRINAAMGGQINLVDGGMVLNVPAGALANDQVITASKVNNPPANEGWDFVGSPIDLEPSGLTFSKPTQLQITVAAQQLFSAAATDINELELFSYDKTTRVWSREKILFIDPISKVVTAQVSHFSFYSLFSKSRITPTDLGIPQPGDLLFRLTTYIEGLVYGWLPGHVAIKVGVHKWAYNTKDLVAPEVITHGKFNVVEMLWDGCYFSYYDIPNDPEKTGAGVAFASSKAFMGSREPAFVTLTAEQRKYIVEHAIALNGAPYVQGQTYGATFGMLAGSLVKGPQYNCVGLPEGLMEQAGVNHGDGIVPSLEEVSMLTPLLLYSKTKPATGMPPAVVPVNPGWTEVTP